MTSLPEQLFPADLLPVIERVFDVALSDDAAIDLDAALDGTLYGRFVTLQVTGGAVSIGLGETNVPHDDSSGLCGRLIAEGETVRFLMPSGSAGLRYLSVHVTGGAPRLRMWASSPKPTLGAK